MLKEFVEKITALAAPNYKDLEDGRVYSDKHLTLITEPEPEPIQTHNLSSLIEYIREALDDSPGQIINIVSPTLVTLLSELNALQQRKTYMEISYKMPAFPFGQYLSLDIFIIGLQSKFEDTPTRAEILKIIGNVKSENVVTMKDDGVSQKVEVATGAANVDNKIIPNPVTLIPYRTFPDVEQPESHFILRMSSANGLTCALFEADGEQWKVATMANIKKWLEEELKDTLNSPTILA